jgi:hypothetical protein
MKDMVKPLLGIRRNTGGAPASPKIISEIDRLYLDRFGIKNWR